MEENSYRIETKVRNNRILSRIAKAGYPSIQQFCNKNGLPPGALCDLIGFRQKPTKRNGDWRDLVWDLSSALRCEPEELFTPTQLKLLTKKTVSIRDVSETQFAIEVETPERISQNKELVRMLTVTLKPRELHVLHEINAGASQVELAAEYGVCQAMIGVVHNKAKRKMQNNARFIENWQRDLDQGIAR